MATLTYLTTTHFDFGAVQKIPTELRRAGISKPFIATDNGVCAAGLVEIAIEAIGSDVPISIFDETFVRLKRVGPRAQNILKRINNIFGCKRQSRHWPVS